MNLLGLLLASFLRSRLADPKLLKRALRVRGNFGLTVGQMSLTLCFSQDGLLVQRGIAPKTRARIKAPMNEIVPLVTGSGGIVAAAIAVLEQRIHIAGNPFALLSIAPIMFGSAKAQLAQKASTR
jgi:hypothetical protein